MKTTSNQTQKQIKPTKPSKSEDEALLDELGDDLDALDSPDSMSLDMGEGGIPLPPEGYDPLKNAKTDGTLEEVSVSEMHELAKAFASQAKQEQDAALMSNDSEYWCCFVFQTRDQKEAFLKALGLIKGGDKYIDGQWAAKKLKVEIPPAPKNLGYYLQDRRVKKKWADLPAIERVSDNL